MNKKILIVLIVAIIAFLAVVVYRNSLNGAKTIKNETSESAAATDPSWENVQKRGKLIVGSDIPYGTMEFFDKAGQPDGFDMDVIKEIAKRMGVGVEIRDLDWDALFLAVKSGEIDAAISVIGITEERKKEMLFSIPYLNAGQTIIVRKENKDIAGPQDLKGKKVGTQKNTICYDEIKKYVDPELLFIYDSFDENPEKGIFHDLKVKKIDAVAISYEAAIGVIRNNPGFKIACDPYTNNASDYSGIVTKLGNNSLIEKIDGALRSMKRDGALKDLERKWMSPAE